MNLIRKCNGFPSTKKLHLTCRICKYYSKYTLQKMWLAIMISTYCILENFVLRIGFVVCCVFSRDVLTLILFSHSWGAEYMFRTNYIIRCVIMLNITSTEWTSGLFIIVRQSQQAFVIFVIYRVNPIANFLIYG